VQNQQLNATITARTKLQDRGAVRSIVLKSATDGSVVTIKTWPAWSWARQPVHQAKLNGMPGAGMGIILADGANAMAVSDAVAAKLAELKPFFPNQIDYFVAPTPRPSCAPRSARWCMTLGEAMVLVVIVMFVFLQNFRATLIPAIAVPVVLLGTFGVLSARASPSTPDHVRHGAGHRPAGGRRHRGGGERGAGDARDRPVAQGGHAPVHGEITPRWSASGSRCRRCSCPWPSSAAPRA
jgi:hypothetical protein